VGRWVTAVLFLPGFPTLAGSPNVSTGRQRNSPKVVCCTSLRDLHPTRCQELQVSIGRLATRQRTHGLQMPSRLLVLTPNWWSVGPLGKPFFVLQFEPAVARARTEVSREPSLRWPAHADLLPANHRSPASVKTASSSNARVAGCSTERLID
jgi:hypothetical protein